MMDENLEVVRELFIPTSIDGVWNFLLDEKKMTVWLNADEFVIDIWEGGGFVFPYSFGGCECHIVGQVTILMKPDKYAFTWWEREASGKEWMNCTTVTLNLKEKDDGVLISLVHNGFKYLSPNILKSVHQRYSDYWENSGSLDRLATLILADN